MHGSLMLYLFAGPFAFGGLANYILPLQVGAPDMAFPVSTPCRTGCT
jgi:cytochrome c oxidase subunit 1